MCRGYIIYYGSAVAVLIIIMTMMTTTTTVMMMMMMMIMKKALRETQTLHAGCSKAEPKIFAPPQTPFPVGAGRPKFNQLEMVTTFTYTNPVW